MRPVPDSALAELVFGASDSPFDPLIRRPPRPVPRPMDSRAGSDELETHLAARPPDKTADGRRLTEAQERSCVYVRVVLHRKSEIRGAPSVARIGVGRLVAPPQGAALPVFFRGKQPGQRDGASPRGSHESRDENLDVEP